MFSPTGLCLNEGLKETQSICHQGKKYRRESRPWFSIYATESLPFPLLLHRLASISTSKLSHKDPFQEYNEAQGQEYTSHWWRATVTRSSLVMMLVDSLDKWDTRDTPPTPWCHNSHWIQNCLLVLRGPPRQALNLMDTFDTMDIFDTNYVSQRS